MSKQGAFYGTAREEDIVEQAVLVTLWIDKMRPVLCSVLSPMARDSGHSVAKQPGSHGVLEGCCLVALRYDGK